MYKLVAFDMDGTIADTIPMCIRAFRSSVSPYTDHELGEEEIIRTFGLNERGMVKAVAGQCWEAALEDFYAQYELLHSEITEAFPGICSLLTFLREKHIPVALVTGKGERSCAITLEKLGLSKMFEDVLYGSETAPNKKENLEYLLTRYAVSKEEICYIGDTVQDIRVCQEMGISCLSAAWQESANKVLLEKENPGLVFGRVRDVTVYLKQNIL